MYVYKSCNQAYLSQQVQEGVGCGSCHIEIQSIQQDALNTQQVTLQTRKEGTE
jgi:hypothetical protein